MCSKQNYTDIFVLVLYILKYIALLSTDNWYIVLFSLNFICHAKMGLARNTFRYKSSS